MDFKLLLSEEGTRSLDSISTQNHNVFFFLRLYIKTQFYMSTQELFALSEHSSFPDALKSIEYDKKSSPLHHLLLKQA
jgi:hypothetical protein